MEKETDDAEEAINEDAVRDLPRQKDILLWFEEHKFVTMGIFLLIVWGSLFVLFYTKADEITKHPCQVCSEKMGKNVVCRVGDTIPVFRTYYPNGSIVDTTPNVKETDILPTNFSMLLPVVNVTRT